MIVLKYGLIINLFQADWKYKMYLAMGHVDLLEGRPRAAINKFNNAKEIHFDERIKNAVKKAETLLELKLEEQRERRIEEEVERSPKNE